MLVGQISFREKQGKLLALTSSLFVLMLASCSSVSSEESADTPTTVATAVAASLSNIEAKSSLNAFVHVDEEGARARASTLDRDAAQLPLEGMVIGVKDNVHVAGIPNTAGTPALRLFVPTESASIVTRLEAAGAVVMGKTGLHELAYGITSDNYAFGSVRNPVDESRTPGGSSGGSAAAVAGRLVDVAIGTDTGGSVRLPASLTGVVGFRPTVGRYPNDGVTLISPTRDTVGFIAKTVSEVILFDEIATGTDKKQTQFDLKGLRLGVPKAHFYENLDPDVSTAADSFLANLSKWGVTLVYEDLTDVPELNQTVSFPVVLHETGQVLPKYLEENKTGVTAEALLELIESPDVKPILEAALGGAITADAYNAALNIQRPKLKSAYKSYFEKYSVDAVVFPTSPITARPIDGLIDGVMVNGEKKDTFSTYIQNTDPGSNAGIPGISIPVSVSSEGLPIGFELDGPEGSDDRLLAIALAIETAVQRDTATSSSTTD